MTRLAGTGSLAIGGLAAAALLSAAPAAAQERALRQARDEVAGEFVAETYPMTDERRARAQGGRIGPYCNMQYPDTATAIGADTVDLPRAEQVAIAQAVDMQVVRQNLVAAGAPDFVADAVASGYRSARVSFDQKTEAEKEAARQAGEDPASALVKMANLAGKLFGLPTFVAGESCNRYAHAVLRTPYRLLTEPPDADVFVIPRFSFRVCEKRLADPYSRQDCAAWVKVPTGSPTKVGGIYQYSVEWPDGAREREQTEFEYQGTQERDLLLASKRSP